MNERKIAVAKFSAIKNGEMREVDANGTKVLLVRTGDQCFALGATCTHYGAPLVQGALVGERIICPWHHACFRATSGDLLEPPALDALPRFALEIEGDDIFVTLPEKPADRRTPDMAKRDSAADERVFVILGGGAAGYAAAQTLREDDFKGRIVMITRESQAPYDRPKLSKNYLQGKVGPKGMPLRPDEFFDEYGIEILRDKIVTSVDAAAKTVTFQDGETLPYDSLLVATGGEPHRLDLPGTDLKNIFALRSFDSADAIIAAAQNAQNAVVIGASFIGMETACGLKERGLAVTVVAPGKVPFEQTLGAEIGQMLQKLHEKNGVQFRLGAHATGFEGEGKVRAVVLDTGERITADLVIAGVGVVPATSFLNGVTLHKDGGVVTDEHLRAGEDFYAAGDIARFPDARSGASTRIEHWRTALQQGRTAAHNMTGKETAYTAVPFFWTVQFGANLRYVGHAQEWDEIIFQGDVAQQKFLAFYVKDDRVLAIAGSKRDRDLASLQEMMRLDQIPALDSLRDGSAKFSPGD